MLTFKRQVISALNIKIKNTQIQTKPVYDFYKNSLDNVMNNNIDEIIDNTNLYLVKLIILTILPKTICNIFLLLGLFIKKTSSTGKNFSFFAQKNMLSKLLLSIMSKRYQIVCLSHLIKIADKKNKN